MTLTLIIDSNPIVLITNNIWMIMMPS